MYSICLNEFLKDDEEKVYNGILKKLNPGVKWTRKETQDYIDLSFANWSDDIEIL
jgi:hypothetical protein